MLIFVDILLTGAYKNPYIGDYEGYGGYSAYDLGGYYDYQGQHY